MLAAYREIKNGQMDTTALEVHLSNCAACRALLVQSNLVGERMRALPAIEPPADAHTKLMKALAIEHIRFIQTTPPSAQSTPIPDFLAPYLHEHAWEVAHTDNIAAFSTAVTGPLPPIQAPRKRPNARRPFQMNHFAVVGLAAAFLMVIMLGGLTSLVILASRGVQGTSPITTSITPLSPLALTNYTTATTYPHIVSAIANRQNIYYTAYNDTNSDWTLSALDNGTKISTPLLSKESTSPMIVLSSSEDWLIWLQFDLPKTVVSKNAHSHSGSSHRVRTWSLHATYLGTDPATVLTTSTPITLNKGTFDAAAAPAWVNTPVPGTWLTKDTLLAATIDEKGTAHLTRYELNAEKSPSAIELATVTATIQQNTGTMLRTDPTVYGPQLDEQLPGTLQTFSAIDDTPVQMPLDSRGPVLAPQAGARFILWQSSDKGIGMYDVVARQPVVVSASAIPTSTTLLAVNGDTAVWTANSCSASTNITTGTDASITFSAFNWPTRAPSP